MEYEAEEKLVYGRKSGSTNHSNRVRSLLTKVSHFGKCETFFPGVRMELKPTLWRTCRALANLQRLRLLRALIALPGQTVTELADAACLSVAISSRYLRDLNARGLVSPVRFSRFVRYYPESDRSVASADPLLKALMGSVSGNTDKVKKVFRILTAMTHPRRVEIIKLLTQGEKSIEALRRDTGYSKAALMRHIVKLRNRGFVGRLKRGVWQCLPQKHKLARCLVSLAGS